MKAKLFAALAAAALLALSACGGQCASLYVDNREEDLKNPERVNLRAEPSTASAIVGLYYTGTEVEDLGAVNDAFTKVRVGGVEGYMVSSYLTTWEDALARRGPESGFGACRAAQVDLQGMWRADQPLLGAMDEGAQALTHLTTGDAVSLAGIVGDWAYVFCGADGARLAGYVPLDALTDVGAGRASIVASDGAEGGVTLYDRPNNDADAVMLLQNGAACLAVFGRGEGNWRRVRVGGVSGWVKYTQADALVPLDGLARAAVPYYPQVMRAREGAYLTSLPGGAGGQSEALSGERVEVLALRGAYAYVRTLEGGAGAYDAGRYGYAPLASLEPCEQAACLGVAQIDDGDLPALLLAAPEPNAERIGALCAGAQVRVADYTQTRYAKVTLGGVVGYVRKDALRILSCTGASPTERIPQRARTREAVLLSPLPGDAPDGDPDAGVVGAGERVYMLGIVGGWAYVRYADGPGLERADALDVSGFVPLASLEAPASTTHLTASVSIDKVNLRDREDKSGEIIGRARLGELLRVADYGVHWCCVVTPDGKRGYIMTEYLEFG